MLKFKSLNNFIFIQSSIFEHGSATLGHIYKNFLNKNGFFFDFKNGEFLIKFLFENYDAMIFGKEL
jgi:hypothetical protein